MSDDNGFVERPAVTQSRRRGGFATRLRETAENGKALLVKRGSVSGQWAYLRAEGLRVRMSIVDAPPGMTFVWAEKMEPKP